MCRSSASAVRVRTRLRASEELAKGTLKFLTPSLHRLTKSNAPASGFTTRPRRPAPTAPATLTGLRRPLRRACVRGTSTTPLMAAPTLRVNAVPPATAPCSGLAGRCSTWVSSLLAW